MDLGQAEKIAKAKMKEFFSSRGDEVKLISQRLVFYSEKHDAGWIVYLGVLPRDAQSFEDFKKSPDLDDSEGRRAKDWLKVLVSSESHCSDVEEVNSLSELI